jgi:hypothetical protein
VGRTACNYSSVCSLVNRRAEEVKPRGRIWWPGRSSLQNLGAVLGGGRSQPGGGGKKAAEDKKAADKEQKASGMWNSNTQGSPDNKYRSK